MAARAALAADGRKFCRAELHRKLAAAVAFAARRLWRAPCRNIDDQVILDLLVEALHRMGKAYREPVPTCVANCFREAPPHVADLVAELVALAVPQEPPAPDALETSPEMVPSPCTPTGGVVLPLIVESDQDEPCGVACSASVGAVSSGHAKLASQEDIDDQVVKEKNETNEMNNVEKGLDSEGKEAEDKQIVRKKRKVKKKGGIGNPLLDEAISWAKAEEKEAEALATTAMDMLTRVVRVHGKGCLRCPRCGEHIQAMRTPWSSQTSCFRCRREVLALAICRTCAQGACSTCLSAYGDLDDFRG